MTRVAPVLRPADLDALRTLIDRLETTKRLSSQDAAERRRKFSSKVAHAMLNDGVSSGVAAGAPAHLTQGEEHFRAEMARMNDLLGEQVRIFQQGLDQWFQFGETFAPYYPHRIAVILRKAKRGDLEQVFLRAYLRQFSEWNFGGRYSEILTRAAKLGVTTSENPHNSL